MELAYIIIFAVLAASNLHFCAVGFKEGTSTTNTLLVVMLLIGLAWLYFRRRAKKAGVAGR